MSYLRPGVPKAVTILTGPKTARSYRWARSYAEYVKQHGIDARVVATAGSAAILESLAEREEPIVAFLLSGVERRSPADSPPEELESLGSLYFDPMWVFVHNDSGIEDVPDMRDKRVFYGRPGSDTRATASTMLHVYGLSDHIPSGSVEELTPQLAAKALLTGDLDAVFLIGSTNELAVMRLLTEDSVHPLSIRHGDVYSRIQPDVGQLTVAQGLFDLAKMIPREEVQVLAPAMNLVAGKNLHPALVDLFLDAAGSIHGPQSLLAPRGTFPSADYTSLPMNPDAVRYYEKGPRGLRKYLPFWLATIIDRVMVYVVPFLVVLTTVFKGIPVLLNIKIQLSFNRFYKRLVAIEIAADKDNRREELLRELDAIEVDSGRLRVPKRYLHDYFDLRQFIHDMRDRLTDVTG